MFLCIIDNCKIDYERHIVMDSIKKEAQKDGFEDVIELGSIDGKDEVSGSSPDRGSKKLSQSLIFYCK